MSGQRLESFNLLPLGVKASIISLNLIKANFGYAFEFLCQPLRFFDCTKPLEFQPCPEIISQTFPIIIQPLVSDCPRSSCPAIEQQIAP